MAEKRTIIHWSAFSWTPMFAVLLTKTSLGILWKAMDVTLQPFEFKTRSQEPGNPFCALFLLLVAEIRRRLEKYGMMLCRRTHEASLWDPSCLLVKASAIIRCVSNQRTTPLVYFKHSRTKTTYWSYGPTVIGWGRSWGRRQVIIKRICNQWHKLGTEQYEHWRSTWHDFSACVGSNGPSIASASTN